MTREDLRPRAETTLRDLCALLYPATAGHDVVVYAAGDGPWSACWRWAAHAGEEARAICNLCERLRTIPRWLLRPGEAGYLHHHDDHRCEVYPTTEERR